MKRSPLFTAVLLLATAATRLLNLHNLPPGLARDEALNADIAEAILNGRHALFFREGYGHEPLYHYLGGLFQALIGDNWLAIRLPSAFASVVLGALIYRWVRQLLNEKMAWLAVSIHAMLWWGIIFGRVGLRPILYPMLLVAAVIVWEKRPVVSGILIGLCVYTYTAGQIAPLIPFGFAILWFAITRFKPCARSKQAKASFIRAAVSVVIASPLYILLQSDPALRERVEQLSGVLDSARGGDLRPLFDNIVQTVGMIGFTGSPLSSYGLPDAPVFGVIVAVFAYFGLLIVMVRAYKQNAYRLILIGLIVALLPTILAEDAPSLIRSIGALPVIILLPCVAVDAISVYAKPCEGFLTFARLRAVLFLCAAVLIIPTAYRSWDQGQEWTARPDIRKKYQSIWVDIERDFRDGDVQLVVADGWYEPVKADSLRRNGNGNKDEERPVRWVQQGRALVVPDGGGALVIPEFAPVDVRLMDAAGVDPQPEYRSENAPSYALHSLVDRDFDEQIETLNGLTLLDFTVLDEEMITIWRVDDLLSWDLSLFVHVIQNEEVITQHDGFDVGAETLVQGDVVYQLHLLDWASLPSAEYDINVGAYHTTTGERLLTESGDSVISLGEVER